MATQERMLDSRWPRITLVIALVILLAVPASPQILTGDILGRVADQSGAVMPGVAVTVQSAALLGPRSVTTGPTGAYHVPALPIGTYAIVFEIQGFRRVVREGIRIEAGFTANVDVELG